MSTHFDTVVLGAGPGGYVAAIRASQLGQKVAIIEEKYWGGICLNVGCIPSKSLLKNASVVNTFSAKSELFGISGKVNFDFTVAYQRSRNVAEGRVKGVHFLMKKNKITEYEGVGFFKDKNSIAVTTKNGLEDLTFDNCIIATGSKVKKLPGVEFSKNIVSFEEQILDSNLPKSIAIVGAGPIGMEFAYVLSNYGVEVTIIEFLDRVLYNEEPEVSKVITKAYEKLGINIVTSARVESALDKDSFVEVLYSKDDNKVELSVDRVLVSIGFQPNVEGFGLENTGVAIDTNNAIKIDEFMRTNVSNFYAIGDVTAKLQLAHVAEAQGVVAAETIVGVPTQTLGDYRMMPRVTFSEPQVASFGLTEEQAKAEGHDIKIASFPFMANGKAHGIGETEGFVKIISDTKYGELLGAHMVGPDVGELLPELTLAQKWDLTVNELIRNIHTHPTLSESVQEALHGLAGHMINF